MSFFDESYYLQAKLKQVNAKGDTDSNGKAFTLETLKEAIADAGMTPEQHYNTYGRDEALNPNPYFNESEYLQAKLKQLESNGETDASGKPYTLETLKAAIDATGLSAAEHYEVYGSKETTKDGHLINPSNAFDANAYVAAKLAELKAGPEADKWAAASPADVLNAITSAGMSPVSHYESYGAAEANASKVAMVQTVPSGQRVANDPVRVTLGEVVPGNYNPPSAAPAQATAKPVTKPADMGGLASTEVSPKVVSPEKPLLTPADSGYVAPPATLVDTNEKPVIPPSTTVGTGPNAGFIIVDTATGKGTVVKPNGDVQGTVDVEVKPDGSITPPKADAPVLDGNGGNTNDKPADDNGNTIPPSGGGDTGGDDGGDTGGDDGGDDGGDPNPTPPADTTAPTLVADSPVANGATLTLTYNEALKAGVLAHGAFAVTTTKAATTITVTKAEVLANDPTKVVLTLNTTIDADVTGLKVAYTKPSTGAVVEDAAGNDAATLAATDVARTLTYATVGTFNTAAANIVERDIVTVSDTAVNIQGAIVDLTTNAAKLDVLDASDDGAVDMTVTQFTALASKMTDVNDTVAVKDTFEATNAVIDALLTSAKVSEIDSSNSSGAASALKITAASAEHAGKIVAGDYVIVNGTGADIAGVLGNAKFNDFKASLDLLDASDNKVTLTVAEAGKLGSIKIAADSDGLSGDAITITGVVDEATAITSFTKATIGGKSVRLDAADNGWMLTKAQLDTALAGGTYFNNLVSGDGADVLAITGLAQGNTIDLTKWGGAGTYETTAVGTSALVTAAGKWHFAAGTLTYWDATAGAAASMTLSGVADVTVASGGTLTIGTVNKNFTATVTSGVLTFGGNVAGDIAITGTLAAAIFTCDGQAAAAVNLTGVTGATAGAGKFTATSTVFDLVKDTLANNSIRVSMADATTDVAAVHSHRAKIVDGGITGAITLTETQYTDLAAKITDTDNDATVSVSIAGTTAPAVTLSAKIDKLLTTGNDMVLTAEQVAALTTHTIDIFKTDGTTAPVNLSITGAAADVTALVDTTAEVTALEARVTGKVQLNLTGNDTLTVTQAALASATKVTLDATDTLAITAATGAVADYSAIQSVATKITVTGANNTDLSITKANLDKLEDLIASGSGKITFTDAEGATFTDDLGQMTLGTGKIEVTAKAGNTGTTFVLTDKVGAFTSTTGDQTVDMATNSLTTGTIDLGSGADTLLVKGTLTANINGGADVGDILKVMDTTDLTGATVAGFETLAFGAEGKSVTANVAQFGAITSVSGSTGIDTLTVNFAATGSETLDLAEITGTGMLTGTDVLNITCAASGDTIKFGATTDTVVATINGFTAGTSDGDVLDFSALVSNTTGTATVKEGDSSVAIADGDVLFVKSATPLTTSTDIAALFGASGTEFALPTVAGEYVLVAGKDIWVITNATGDTAITAEECVKVATMGTALTFAGADAANFEVGTTA